MQINFVACTPEYSLYFWSFLQSFSVLTISESLSVNGLGRVLSASLLFLWKNSTVA